MGKIFKNYKKTDYVKIFKKSAWLIKYDLNKDMLALFRGVYWAYIGYFVFFLTATPIMWAPVRYINFFLTTLACLRYKQLETETEYSCQGEPYETTLTYA